MRNFIIDITRTPTDGTSWYGIHWQVGQGTSLENIDFHMSTVVGNDQRVICPSDANVLPITDGNAGDIYGMIPSLRYHP